MIHYAALIFSRRRTHVLGIPQRRPCFRAKSEAKAWFKRSVLGGTSISLFTFGSKNSDTPQDNVRVEDVSRTTNHSKPDEERQNITPTKHADGGLWHGLDFLKESLSVYTISSALSAWTWPSTMDFTSIQEKVSALFLELGLGPGSLYSEIVDTPPDPTVYPEIEWDAEVRLGEEVCLSERAFLNQRMRIMKTAFARLFGVPERDIDERDLPIVALACSGGGYRAMLNTTGSLIGAKRTDILPCITYAAGVSGSCWALGVMYSGVAGSHDPEDAGKHIKERIQTSFFDTDTLDMLTNPPTNKYLLTGILRKAAGSEGTASLVDVYGTLLASRLFVPSDLNELDFRHLSLHLTRRNIDNGLLPLPIYTTIQHAASPAQSQVMREITHEEDQALDETRRVLLGKARLQLEDEVRCLWYELTPFEVGCDEIAAWIPSWGLGRHFFNGKNIERRPELGMAILTGIVGSAFCASLKHYFREIQPTLKSLPFQLYHWLEDIVTENERDLGLIHPVLPDQVPNFLKGLDGQLRNGSPADLTQQEYMTLMDAGAELNLPYYPLLRRNVDCIIALDASADSQDLWFTRAEELAAKRGLRTWPKGAGWPTVVKSDQLSEGRTPEIESDADAANLRLAKAQESALTEQTVRQESTNDRAIPQSTIPDSSVVAQGSPLGVCEVWIGSSDSSDADSSRLDDFDEDALLKRDGIGVVYIPLAPNERKVPDFDPFAISTWRREVSPAESQALLDVAEANFSDSTTKIIRLLRAIWLRKKYEREKHEWDIAWRERLKTFHKNLRKNF